MSQTLYQKMVDRYIEAELEILDGKTVTMNGRTMGMENLNEIRHGRQEWERRLNNAKSKRGPYKVARFT